MGGPENLVYFPTTKTSGSALTVGHKKTRLTDGSSDVQVGRLELPSLAALIPETSVSTNSTTPASTVQKYKTGDNFTNIIIPQKRA